MTATVVLAGCVFLVFLSQWNAHGGFGGSRNPPLAINYMFGAVVLGFVGVCFMVWLGRGVQLGRQPPAAAGRLAFASLIWCLGIRIALNVLDGVYIVLQFQQALSGQSAIYHSYIGSAVLACLLYALPYAILIYLLCRHPSRIVLAFALVLPAVAILQRLLVVYAAINVYTRNPVSLALLTIGLIVNGVTVFLAYQAAQRSRLQASASSLFTAIVISAAYFYSIMLIVPILRRLATR